MVCLVVVVRKMSLGLDQQRRHAMIDDLPRPLRVFTADHRLGGSALTALISATLAVFSQTRARAALWSVPTAAR